MNNFYMFLLSLIVFHQNALAYSPIFPKDRYYFYSENKQFLVEVTPSVLQTKNPSLILVRKIQNLTIYQKENENTWHEINSFGVEKLPLINEVLISDNGEILVIKTDENPMNKNTNKKDAIFIFSIEGKKTKAYSHYTIFKKPGIFREMKLKIDSKNNDLLIINQDKIKKISLAKESTKLTQFKGVELYCIKKNKHFKYVLMMGTNRLKTKTEIESSSNQLDIDSVLKEIKNLAPGSYISIGNENVENKSLCKIPKEDKIKINSQCKHLKVNCQF
ncbi:MAG: hypothetical protein R3B45_10290 [Bdellovibrionota bacterium]